MLRDQMGPGAADICGIIPEVRDKLPHLESVGPYKSDLVIARDIYRIGHVREAVAVVGRALETACWDTLTELRWSQKIRIPQSRVSNMDFDGVVHFLHNPRNGAIRIRRVISQRQRDNILSVKWDRNVGDHPAPPEEIAEVEEMSAAKVEVGFSSLKILLAKQTESRQPPG